MATVYCPVLLFSTRQQAEDYALDVFTDPPPLPCGWVPVRVMRKKYDPFKNETKLRVKYYGDIEIAASPSPSLRSVGIFERSPGGCGIENKGLFGLSGSILAENVWAHDQGQIA